MTTANEILQQIIEETEGKEVVGSTEEVATTQETTTAVNNGTSAETTTVVNSTTSGAITGEITNEEEVKVDEEKNQEIKDLEAKLIAKQEKSIEVLKSIQDKVSDNAKDTIAAVIEMQTAKKEAMIQMVEKRHELNAVKKELAEVITQVKDTKESGNEEAVKAAEEALKASVEKLDDSKAAFKEGLSVPL
jgi:glucose-6-phosphate isomerase